MLQPKRTKYRKQFKGRNDGLAQRGSNVSFGEFGLKAGDRVWLSPDPARLHRFDKDGAVIRK